MRFKVNDRVKICNNQNRYSIWLRKCIEKQFCEPYYDARDTLENVGGKVVWVSLLKPIMKIKIYDKIFEVDCKDFKLISRVNCRKKVV